MLRSRESLCQDLLRFCRRLVHGAVFDENIYLPASAAIITTPSGWNLSCLYYLCATCIPSSAIAARSHALKTRRSPRAGNLTSIAAAAGRNMLASTLRAIGRTGAAMSVSPQILFLPIGETTAEAITEQKLECLSLASKLKVRIFGVGGYRFPMRDETQRKLFPPPTVEFE